MSHVVENWLPVLNSEGRYEVSDLGRVRSVDRMVPHGRGGGLRIRKGQILKPGRKPSGHLSVAIGKGNSVDVHVLVLTAFCGPPPQGHWALHRDDNPSNNVLENLRWGTPSENIHDAIANGKRRVGEGNWNAKLTKNACLEISSSKESNALLAKKFGVCAATIRQVRVGRTWKRELAA